MGRFIHLAWRRRMKPCACPELQMAPEDATRVGVHISQSGIGGFDVIEREHINLIQGGPA